MTTNIGRAPGFLNHPNLTVRISPSARRWIGGVGEAVFATSERALVLVELVEESSSIE